MSNKIKVAVIFNEPKGEQYDHIVDIDKHKLDFEAFFETSDLTPEEEFNVVSERLKDAGYDSYALNIHNNLNRLIYNLRNNKPDVIFNFIEHFADEPQLEMNVAALFELIGIPYTGAPPLALSMCQNKILTKQILHSYDIKTPKFKMIKKKKRDYKLRMKYPLIVKPPFEDASSGIENASVVRNYEDLKQRIDFILDEFKQPALIEEFIEGREINVSILGDKELEVLPISETDFSEMPDHLENIVSYEAKWDPLHEAYHKTYPICPAPLTKRLKKKIEEIAINSFRIMGVRDYARVDMRISKTNVPYVLEVNPNPDLSEGVAFMRSAETAGYKYEEMLVKIVELALKRSG